MSTGLALGLSTDASACSTTGGLNWNFIIWYHRFPFETFCFYNPLRDYNLVHPALPHHMAVKGSLNSRRSRWP